MTPDFLKKASGLWTAQLAHKASILGFSFLVGRSLDAAGVGVMATVLALCWIVVQPLTPGQLTHLSFILSLLPAAATTVALPNRPRWFSLTLETSPSGTYPPHARHAKVYNTHAYEPLLSLGQLADRGYVFTGTNEAITLTHPTAKPLIS